MRKNPLKTAIFITAIALSAVLPRLSYSAEITSYKAVFRPFSDSSGNILIATREFERGSSRLILTVNPDTFETAVMEEAESLGKPIGTSLDDTRFMKALSRYEGPLTGPQDHGLRNAPTEQGVFITIDLCQSQKKLDYELFRFLEVYSKGEPAPVAVALSGKWLKKHAEGFRWLLEEQAAKRLDITWVNHSYSHPYKGGILPEEDFLLLDKNKFEEEALMNESLMLESGIIPSPFFRFPGLIADEELLKRLKKLALIPIGSGAWLAKGQTPNQGSVILVHGNGNEPAGVKALFKYLADHVYKIRLLPLKSALR